MSEAYITEYIFLADKIQPVDVLIILGGSWIELMDMAAEIYQKGYAPRIIASGKYSVKAGRVRAEMLPAEYQRYYRTESEMIKTILMSRHDIPDEDIIEECKSTNTYENARNTLQMLSETDKRIGVCCQAFHARRVKMTFDALSFKSTIFLFPVSTQGINWDNWAKTDYGKMRVAGELERIKRYFPMS